MISSGLFLAALCGLATTFLIYPLLLSIIAWLREVLAPAWANLDDNISMARQDERLPSVQMLIVGYAPGWLLRPKLENSLNLDYPVEKLHLLLGFDGSADPVSASEPLLRSPRVTVFEGKERVGKCLTINRVMERAVADIVVFSDIDAILAPDALRHLVQRLEETGVGAICGRRVIGEPDMGFASAQDYYIDFDSRIKMLEENAFGSITSNDGKLYAMYRDLFRPMPAVVTDDLYNGLSVILGGRRMVFDRGALALIRKPSRGGQHEIARRRRIICRSLSGIFARPRLFVPWRYRGYGMALFLNKVNRRLLPFYLLIMLVTAVAGASDSALLAFALAAQLGFYVTALLYGAVGDDVDRLPAPLRRLGGLIYYFVLGNLGMLLGWWDFLRGKRIAVWEPNKNNGPLKQ